jgi:hypothetical protein
VSNLRPVSASIVSTRLPTFLVVGAMKAGTTSLAAYLRSHPDVYVPAEKELFFFTPAAEHGHAGDLDWYQQHFAPGEEALARGEASPLYLVDPAVPAAVAALVPDVRLVAVLREPVARAWSHYWHRRRFRTEGRSFEESLAAERAGEQYDFGYVNTGRYVEHLRRWEQHFPRSSMLVCLLDDLERDPARVFADVCRHLAVDPGRANPDFGEVHNRGHQVRSYRFNHVMWKRRIYPRLPERFAHRVALLNHVDGIPEMPAASRAELTEEFRSSNRDLAEWLGRPLPEAWST